MVHFKNTTTYFCGDPNLAKYIPASRTSYWKLEHHNVADHCVHIRALKTSGIRDPVSLLARLGQPAALLRYPYLHTRLDLGQIIYETCNDAELLGFIINRNLTQVPTEIWCRDREWMITILERADSDAKFEKFLELPAELRIGVYEFYIKNLDLGRWSVVPQPPLARVSRLVRKEVMPLCEGFCAWDGCDLEVRERRNVFGKMHLGLSNRG